MMTNMFMQPKDMALKSDFIRLAMQSSNLL